MGRARPIELPAPGESAGCGDVVPRLLMLVARKVVLLGLLLVGVGVLTLVM